MKTLRPEFFDHPTNLNGVTKQLDLVSRFSSMLDDLETVCGKDGREMALVRTHLQEAAFWAQKAVTTRAENQAEFVVEEIAP